MTADAVVIHRRFGRGSAGFGSTASVDYPIDQRIVWALEDARRMEAEKTLKVIGNVESVSLGGVLAVRPNRGVRHSARPLNVIIPGAGEQYAADAWHHLKKLIDGKSVTVEYNRQDTTGALVGVITCGKSDVGLRMIKDGYAKAGPEAPETYRAAQREAKGAQRGMWAPPVVLPAPAPAPVVPPAPGTNSVRKASVPAPVKRAKAR